MELELDYQNISPRLEEILQSINRSGDFCTYGRVTAPMPRLEVENVGILSFPVPRAQIDELIKTANPAPYGKGSQTIVDASVRNCWEINTDRILLGGKSWDKTIRRIKRRVADGLGCPRKQLSAELYKLLVYPTGGFFAPHRDTEKSEGMIATLTISLPAEGAGGEIIVQHKDKEITIETNSSEPSELIYAAFYADCKHEIKKVRSGHRIALVYNLCLKQGDADAFGFAPDYTAELNEIVKELRIWCEKKDAVNKLVWILDHEYSRAGLSFNTLKNRDRALAKVLKLATKQVECELYASIVNIYDLFNAWYAGSGYYHDESDIEDWEIDFLIESQIWLDSWVSPDGSNPNFGEMSISDYELMPAGILDDATPDLERIEEATGNEGATLERSYHFAALVAFRHEGMLDELTRNGASSGVAWIAEQLKRNGGIVDDHIISLTDKLIDIWPAAQNDYHGWQGISEMLRLLLKLGNQPASVRFLREIAIGNYKGSGNDELAMVLSALSPTDTENILHSLVGEKFSDFPEEILQLLVHLDRKVGHSVRNRQQIFATCAAEVLQALPEALSQMENKVRYKSFGNWKQSKFQKNTIENLVMLFWHANAMDDVNALSKVLEHFPATASIDRALPKALVELRKISDIYASNAYSSLWHVSASYLLDRSCTPPEPPKDWKMSCNTSCGCWICDELREFCEDPNQSVARFPLKKDLRAHLHQIIDANRLDITHVTERQGRPYTLVCTKNRATYKLRQKEYAKDIGYMNSLMEVMAGAETVSQVEAQFTELQVAIEQSKQLN